MTTRAIFLTAVSVLLVPLYHSIQAQDLQLPKDYKFATQEEFTKVEPVIIKCADFLESAPLDENQDFRKQVNAFFLRWLTGTAHVNVSVQPYVTDLAENNKDFLMVYLSGWARFVLLHPEIKTELDFHVAGVRSVLKAYKQCKGAEQEDLLDELIGLDKEGKLRDWIADKLPKK
jgi:hypothetical protein